jgi:hypothetical protein
VPQDTSDHEVWHRRTFIGPTGGLTVSTRPIANVAQDDISVMVRYTPARAAYHGNCGRTGIGSRVHMHDCCFGPRRNDGQLVVEVRSSASESLASKAIYAH